MRFKFQLNLCMKTKQKIDIIMTNYDKDVVTMACIIRDNYNI